jgi:glycerophosphoryl diester phosphodiesterase
MGSVAFLVLVVLLALWRGPLWRARPLPGVTRPRPLRIGHRGVRGRHPENGLPACRHALEAGLDGLEVDVQRTADGALVLVHDEVVAGLRVIDTPAADLAPHVPDLTRLEELLEEVRAHPGTLLNVELKTTGWRDGGGARAVARLLRGSGLEDRVIVSSFNPIALARFRLAAPELRTGYLWTDDPLVPRPLRSSWPAGWLHVDALHPHHALVDEALLARAARRGLAVNVWTVNAHDDILRLGRLGVSAIMADDPSCFEGVSGGGA